MSSEQTPCRLITIPISHYCEKARWALDRSGIPYLERAPMQLIHRFAARRPGGGTTVPVMVCGEPKVRASFDEVGRLLSDSPYPTRAKAKSKGRARSIAIRATDEVGNVSDVATVSFKVFRTPPLQESVARRTVVNALERHDSPAGWWGR